MSGARQAGRVGPGGSALAAPAAARVGGAGRDDGLRRGPEGTFCGHAARELATSRHHLRGLLPAFLAGDVVAAGFVALAWARFDGSRMPLRLPLALLLGGIGILVLLGRGLDPRRRRHRERLAPGRQARSVHAGDAREHTRQPRERAAPLRGGVDGRSGRWLLALSVHRHDVGATDRTALIQGARRVVELLAQPAGLARA
jgi:hypothetical protein